METPNYYAILPASVRYDKELSSTAKLLYAEITALATKSGYCFATNGYFAELYGTTERTITRTIKLLTDKGYIIPKMEDGRRVFYIADASQCLGGGQKCLGGIDKNVQGGIDKNVQQNNTRINNTSINKKDIEERVQAYTQNEDLREALMDFVEHRKTIGKPLSDIAFKRCLSTLDRIGHSDLEKLRIIEKTITRRWAGFFPLKDDEKVDLVDRNAAYLEEW